MQHTSHLGASLKCTKTHERKRNREEQNATTNRDAQRKRKHHFIVTFGKDALWLVHKMDAILRVRRPRKRRVHQCVAIMLILMVCVWAKWTKYEMSWSFRATMKQRSVQWSIRHAKQTHMQRTQLTRQDAMSHTETSRENLKQVDMCYFNHFNSQSNICIPS
jgi:hypothetical protein